MLVPYSLVVILILNAMRRAILLFVVLSATAAAQNPVPDTTDWHRYIPLEIGNEWHYAIDIELYPGLPIYERSYFLQEVVGDSTVLGIPYFLVESCGQREGETATCSEEYSLVRLDELTASVVQRRESGSEIQWGAYPCSLDAPFSSGGDWIQTVCPNGGEQEFFIYGELHESYDLLGTILDGPITHKIYSTLASGADVLSDVGLLGWWFGDPGCSTCASLAYARLNGVEYGDPVVVVANEGYPELPERHNQLSIFPNPVRSTATLTYVLDTPGRVTLGVFDLQGRKVESLLLGERSSGEHILELDTARWANGLYQVRITNDRGFLATKGIIVIH